MKRPSRAAFARTSEALTALYNAAATAHDACVDAYLCEAKERLTAALAALETEPEPTPVRASPAPWPRAA